MSKNSTKIVLVDDDKAHTVLIKRSLKKSGIENDIISFLTGLEALDFIFSEQQLADSIIIILDINLPDINGIDVLRKLRLSQLTRAVPIIMLTTTDEPKEMEACHKLGCNAYFVKPIDHIEFIEKMAELAIFLKKSKS